MIYTSLLCGVLAVYALFLNRRLTVLKKNLKELLQENERQTTQNSPTLSDIYFKVDRDMIITYVNDATLKITGFGKDELIDRPALGTLFENSDANQKTLFSTLSKVGKNQSTVNTDLIMLHKDGGKYLMRCRHRPLLNEVLACEGMSMMCKDYSQAEVLQEKLKIYQNRDILLTADILNEAGFLERLEHDAKLAKRYNTDFSLVVVELCDIYDFINKGIDFETGDRMLKNVAELCLQEAGKEHWVGRFDKTKFGIVLNKTPRGKAVEMSQSLQDKIIQCIRSQGVDEYNAEMFVISYTNRKDYNDSADFMLARVRRHIQSALRSRQYGIISSDIRRRNSLPETTAGER